VRASMNRTPPSLLVESSEESARKAAVNLLQTRAGKPGYEGMVMAPIQKRLDAVTKAFAEGSEGLEQILSPPEDRMHRTSPNHMTLVEANDDRFKPGEIQFFGLFLDDRSKAKLKQAFPPAHPNKSGDHVTVIFGPTEEQIEGLKKLVGKRKVVSATHALDTGSYQAVKIDGIGTARGNAHVTISWAPGSSPAEGNRALRQEHGDQIQPWLKLNGVFDFYPRTLKESAMFRKVPGHMAEASELASLSDAELEKLLALSDEELEAEGIAASAVQAELDARKGGGGAPAASPEPTAAPAASPAGSDPMANEPADDPAPEPNDPVVLTVEVVERDGDSEDGGEVVKTFEFAGPTKEAALGELKVAARRNQLLRSAMNEVPYKGRNFYLKQNFLDKDPDQPEGKPAVESYVNHVADPGNAWQALAIREAEQDPKWKELEDKWRAEQQERQKKKPSAGGVMGAYEDAEFAVRTGRTGKKIAKAIADHEHHGWMLDHYTAAQFAKAWDQASGIPNDESRWAQAASILTGAKQLSAREKKGRREKMRAASAEVKRRRRGGGRG